MPAGAGEKAARSQRGMQDYKVSVTHHFTKTARAETNARSAPVAADASRDAGPPGVPGPNPEAVPPGGGGEPTGTRTGAMQTPPEQTATSPAVTAAATTGSQDAAQQLQLHKVEEVLTREPQTGVRKRIFLAKLAERQQQVADAL